MSSNEHPEQSGLLSELMSDEQAAPRKKRGGRSPRHIAMDLLARRDHTRSELLTKLSTKLSEQIAADDVSVGDIEAVLDDLESDGLLDEQRYAESFVNSRIRRGQGPARIRRELADKGVAGGSADMAFAAAEVEWLSHAAEVRQKKFGRALPADYKERARQARFLQYRGFTGEQIQRVLGGDSD